MGHAFNSWSGPKIFHAVHCGQKEKNESIINNLQKNNLTGSECFTAEFFQTCNERMYYTILYNLFQKTETKGYLPTHFEASINTKPKTLKENYRIISLMNIHTENLTTFKNRLKHCIKRIIYHDQLGK